MLRVRHSDNATIWSHQDALVQAVQGSKASYLRQWRHAIRRPSAEKPPPEPGFQSGPGDSVDANQMAPCLLVTKSSPPNLLAQEQHMYFFWCLSDYCALVFLCYWVSINQTRLDSPPSGRGSEKAKKTGQKLFDNRSSNGCVQNGDRPHKKMSDVFSS